MSAARFAVLYVSLAAWLAAGSAQADCTTFSAGVTSTDAALKFDGETFVAGTNPGGIRTAFAPANIVAGYAAGYGLTRGAIVYNDTTLGLEICDGTNWIALATAGAAVPDGNTGSIQFKSGVSFAADAANLHWDDTNNRLGIGTAAPDSRLDVSAVTSATSGNYHMAANSLVVQPASLSTAITNATYSFVNFNGSGNQTTVRSLLGFARHSSAAATIGNLYGVFGQAQNFSTGTVTNAIAIQGSALNSSTGTVDSLRGGFFLANNISTGPVQSAEGAWARVHNEGDGTINIAYGLRVDAINTGSSVINTWYGLYVDAITGNAPTTGRFPVYIADTGTNYFAGRIGIGTTTPDRNLTIAASDATTGQLRLRSARSVIVATNVIGGVDFMSNDTNLTAPGIVTAGLQAVASVAHVPAELGTDLTFTTTTGTTTTEKLRILGNGNVGIGTASPQSTLHVPDGKYAQFEDFNAGAPPVGDCDADSERGRQSIDTTNFRLYICMGVSRGWDYITLLP